VRGKICAKRVRRALGASALVVLASSCGSSGCGRHSSSAAATPPPTASSAAPSEPTAEPPAPNLDGLLPTDGAPDSDWRLALRHHEWQRAYELLASLPGARRAEAPIRLVLGFAAWKSGHHAEAAAALAKLEEALPLATAEVKDLRARALLRATLDPASAEVLLTSDRVDDALEVANALAGNADPKLARTAADRAVLLADRSKRRRALARATRASLAERAGEHATSIADHRWILREEPEHGLPSLAALDGLGAPPSLDERLAVVERAASPDTLDAIRSALDKLRAQAGVERGKLALVWGKALSRARRFAEATTALDIASREVTGDAASEARYQAARAAARAGQLREAATRFAKLADARPTSRWSGRARVRLAEVQSLLGKHDEARVNFDRYLASMKPPHEDGVAHARALALLGSGRAKEARKALAELRKASKKSRRSAMLRELEGVAAYLAGDREDAVAIWRDLVAREPLTLASWLAAARLVRAGHAADALPVEPSRGPANGSLDAELPAAAGFFASLGLDELAEARLIQGEDTLARAYAGREAEALCATYGRLATARRRLQVGDKRVTRELLMRAPGVDERWAWRCVYPDAYAGLVAREDQAHSLPRGLVHGVMRQESAFDPGATSPVGARGLMQLMPTTATRAAREAGLTFVDDDVARASVNIRLGAHYLKKLLSRYRENPAVTAAAYNAGPHAVHTWLAHRTDEDLDLWVARIPFRETRDYVAAVVGNMLRYQYLDGGAAAVATPSLVVPPVPVLDDSDY